MKKLSIAIDMGAKNNGVFIVKSKGDKIVAKKAVNIIVDKNSINFSKKSRRENRHKDRNYKRRKLAKRLLKELIDFSSFNEKQQEEVLGLLNNRGYTFISTETEFESLSDETKDFNNKYLKEISLFTSKKDFEEYLTNEFEDEKELLKFLDTQVKTIRELLSDLQNFINKAKILKDLEVLQANEIPTKFKNFSYIKNLLYRYKYPNIGKNEKEIMQNITKEDFDTGKINFEKEFSYIKSLNFEKKDTQNKKIITDDFKLLIDFFVGVKKEIETGSKQRKKYLKEIKEEIKKLDFIKNQESFYNLIGNISNLQLRVLRKFFNFDSSHKDTFNILKTYFKAHHYKKEKESEKETKEKLFKVLDNHSNLKEFLSTCDPLLTIPPYEDMNNRNTYKCNSMLIKPSEISDELRYAIDTVLKNEYFSNLLISNDGEFKKEEEFRTRPQSGNVYKKTDFTYSKYLQRILDSTPELTTKELNPRNVFKHMAMFEKGTLSSVKEFKKVFGDDIYFTLEKFASKYYKEEELITNGIYVESNSIFEKCNTNTSYKNNAKHIMLKPLYSYNFTNDEADKFIQNIENSRGLKTALELISIEAKKYQNGFYNVIRSCFENQKCVDDKDIKKTVDTLPNTFKAIKEILAKQNIKESYFESISEVDSKNLTRVLNILKQTYEILFKELSGFSKTCKHCTKENALRSDENLTIGKRLLSDVAKPIDGMLDMMLDRLAFEIASNIDKKDLDDISDLEILLEQNRFEFEENLIDIKKKSNSQVKQKKREVKDKLNIKICPYTGEEFDKGDYDHILPQSDGVYNSKANMIYASVQGNRNKTNRDYTLKMIHNEHLKEIFKTSNINEIISKIKQGLATINKDEFKNFDALKLTQQIAMRYALFMRGTSEFDKAFELVRRDKLKTITNGTQKRLARLIYEKLSKIHQDEMKSISVNSKTIDNKLVSNTRRYLSVDKNTEEINHLFKEDIQNSHSHCIDAMVVFYLANSKIKGSHHTKKHNLNTIEPIFNFDDIDMDESQIKNISKNKKFINYTFKQSASFQLFKGTIYAENYYIIEKRADKFIAKGKDIEEKNIQLLMDYQLLYKNDKNKKIFFTALEAITSNDKCKIDIEKLSNLLYELFNKKDKKAIDGLKFLDNLRYNTTRKEIVNIFFDDKATQLLEFSKIKDIPPFSRNLFKAVYKKLQNTQNLFKVNEEEKQFLDQKVLNDTLKDMFESKQKEDVKEIRKRGKKRHKYTLPCLGQNAQYKIKRGNTWQILAGEKIATKSYVINGNIKQIPYFTKNTLPLKIEYLSDCLLLDENAKNVDEVDIDVSDIREHVSKLKYYMTSKGKFITVVTLIKSAFNDIDFDSSAIYKYEQNEEFKKFVLEYLNHKENHQILKNYIGGIRNDKKKDKYTASAELIETNSENITLRYTVLINNSKKKIILNNIQ